MNLTQLQVDQFINGGNIVRKNLFILTFLVLSFSLHALGAYDPLLEDYLIVNNYDTTIIVKANSKKNDFTEYILKPNESTFLFTTGEILTKNGIFKIDLLYKYFEYFLVYDENMKLLRDTIFIQDEIELIEDEYGYYYNINLGLKLDLNP